MAQLPTPHSDNETWGQKLNDYLLVGHDANGNHISSTSNVLKTYYAENSTDLLATNSNNMWITGTSTALCAVNFVAPSSGAVLVTLTGTLRSGDNFSGQMSYSVRDNLAGSNVPGLGLSNSGTTGSSPYPGRWLASTPLPSASNNQRWFYGSVTRQITGLGPGKSYTATVYFRNLGTAANGAGDDAKPLASYRSLIVQQLGTVNA